MRIPYLERLGTFRKTQNISKNLRMAYNILEGDQKLFELTFSFTQSFIEGFYNA